MIAGPALTAEEWADLRSGNTRRQRQGNGVAVDGERVLNPHGTAALCLHGQPFGFTWEDVDALNAAAEAIEREVRTDSLRSQMQAPPNAFVGDLGNQLRGLSQRAARLRSTARRIEALLPPR